METQRLFLRERTRELIFDLLQKSAVEQMAFFGFDSIAILEDKMIRVRKGLAKSDLDFRLFDLIEKQSGIVVGSCGFHAWNKEHDRAEIGYETHEKFRRQGFMIEAMVKILEYGFAEMPLNRVEALVEPDNVGSMQLLEKIGFVREGVLRAHYKSADEWEDSVMYSFLKSDIPQLLKRHK